MSREGRRGLVSFDPEFFSREEAAGRPHGARDAFRRAYQENHWQGASPSGPGSTPGQTARIAQAIPALCLRLGVRRLLDLPCGDFVWMASVELGDVSYVGGDLLPEVVSVNRARFGGPGRSFVELDVTSSELPEADLVLCRDCLVHLSFRDVWAALRNIVRSDFGFLLTTTFPEERKNIDIVTGDWRPVDLTKPPFDLPPPLELLNEGCTEQSGAFRDKSLGLWRASSIREHVRE